MLQLKYSKQIFSAFICVAIGGAVSQAASTSEYVGQENRAIKALSESDVADLLAGKGMGFAKAAELNGYPGPSHVLELSSELKLSREQVEQTRAIFQRMEAKARALGVELVEAERKLDDLFRNRAATPELLAASLQRTSALQSDVREAHLNAHIEQTQLLSQEQISRYYQLRGYTGDRAGGEHGHHH